MNVGALPRRSKGRPSEQATRRYNAGVEEFCRLILQINSTLDFKVGSRGWCYILENEHHIRKGNFDTAQELINECRRTGDLPLDICAEDESRASDNLEKLDATDEISEAQDLLRYVQNAQDHWNPISFWDYQDNYLEIVVEKIDLKSLFSSFAPSSTFQ